MHAWVLTKEADGSGASSGAGALRGGTQLGNIPLQAGAIGSYLSPVTCIVAVICGILNRFISADYS